MFERSKTYRCLVFDEKTDLKQLSPIDQAIFSTVVLNQAVSSRPVLLYVLEARERGDVDDAQCLEMLRACLALVFRAKVCGGTGING